jgi:hypothetical protein
MKSEVTVGFKTNANGCIGTVVKLHVGVLDGMCDVKWPGGISTESCSTIAKFPA